MTNFHSSENINISNFCLCIYLYDWKKDKKTQRSKQRSIQYATFLKKRFKTHKLKNHNLVEVLK